ncbi:hypothetical protein KPH14_002419 [Odynerus spinipes]|uniref:P21-activated protein kinase-interacting protein 1-like n=1 Tax=Odynerus spinipes TaxID=1348599 RepID=A0AAD9RM30_9HYME|nr:hypothetical protein KPH14_002419 [Odynerus spinipes]
MVQLDPGISDPFEIVVGTYEQYLLGYKVSNIVNEYKLDKSFATHSHLASIRSVASNKHYLASAGSDDSVYLYDLRTRNQCGRLMHHNDTVNHITFTSEASHLFTCSKDGTIAAIGCGNWQIEKHWQKPHKGLSVNTLAIHPTGKLALSTGADGILRTWNLVKGRQAYATNLVPRLKLDAKNVTVLKWSPNGEKYLLAVNQRLDIYSVELAGIDDEVQYDSKIVCVEFLRDDLIAVGLENGQIKFYDLEKSAHTLNTLAHDIRVKCMAYKDDLLVTASSSGEIKLWRFTKHKIDMLQSINCGARITCLVLAMPYKSIAHKKETESNVEQKVKRKNTFRLRQEVVVEEDGEDDDDEDDEDDDDDDDDDDWEVTSIENTDIKSTTKSKTSLRNSEWIEEDNNPSSKKVKLNTDKKSNKSVIQKKRNIVSIEQDIAISSKKKKLSEDNNNPHIKKRKKEELVQNVAQTSLRKKRKIAKRDIKSGNDVQGKRKIELIKEEENNSKPVKKIKTMKEGQLLRLSNKKKKKIVT